MSPDAPERLTRCVRLVFPGLSPAEARAASAETVDGWDSVSAVTLLALVEEEFGVPVDPDLLMADSPYEAILGHLGAYAF